MKKQTEKFLPLVLGTCLVAAVSCGSDDDDDNGVVAIPQPEEERTLEGVYRVEFTTLNAGIGGNAARGNGIMTIQNGRASVELTMDGVAEGIVHPQFLANGETCPNASADTNGDGIIDVQEGISDYGSLLIQLDSNLTSRTAGQFPTTDASGSYTYFQTVNLEELITSISGPDDNPDDPFVILSENETLALDGKQIIIHGVASDFATPDTVATIGDIPVNETIPIACGRVTSQTNEEESDNSLVFRNLPPMINSSGL